MHLIWNAVDKLHLIQVYYVPLVNFPITLQTAPWIYYSERTTFVNKMLYGSAVIENWICLRTELRTPQKDTEENGTSVSAWIKECLIKR